MAGIRLLHDAGYSNCMVTVSHPYRFYDDPTKCPTCGVVHKTKTYHLWMDDSGGTIVSQVVFDNLSSLGLPGFAVESEVVEPPAAKISMGGTLGRPSEIIREKPLIQLRQNIGVSANG